MAPLRPLRPTNFRQSSRISTDTDTAFAMAHGIRHPPFPDPDALAIEVKSSWVLAAGLPNLSSYITMTATIPTYNQADAHTWTPAGQQTVATGLNRHSRCWKHRVTSGNGLEHL